DAVLAARPEGSARVLLENTAGQGSVLGSRFEQLAHVISLLDRPELVGVCLDTCHAFAAGYELRDPDGYERTLEQIEATIGLDRVLTLHLNDSKEALGSGKDRHENIGRGEIGEAAFARLITDERFSLRPLIL